MSGGRCLSGSKLLIFSRRYMRALQNVYLVLSEVVDLHVER